MDLMWNLNDKFWKNDDPEKYTFKEYTVLRQQQDKPGVFKVAVREVFKEDGDMVVATVNGCTKSPPLGTARNLELIIQDDVVTGINLMGDCVIKK